MTGTWVGDGAPSATQVQREKAHLRALAERLSPLGIRARVVGHTDLVLLRGARGTSLRRPPALHVWVDSDSGPRRLSVGIREGRPLTYVWGEPEQTAPVEEIDQTIREVAAALDVPPRPAV